MNKVLRFGFFMFLALSVSAQQNNVKWKAGIQAQKVFIENKSQFNGRDLKQGSNVLFGTDDGAGMIYFTNSGLTYRFDKVEYNKHKEEKEERVRNAKEFAEKEKEEHSSKTTTDVVYMEWQNANPAAQVVGSEVAPFYYNYGIEKGSINRVKAFRKITYKNLYPNIDVEYIFHPQQGIEYSFILHPGADMSQVKMKYSSTNEMLVDASGNLHLSTKFGDIVDHAPSCGYQNQPQGTIPVQFVKSGKTVSFSLGAYDHSQTVVIDPWTATPNMPSANSVFYIKSDAAGNAYLYGGDAPYRLQKYDVSGSLVWTYSTAWTASSHWFGALAVDKMGNSYITNGDGATLAKVDTGGAFKWSNTAPGGFGLAIEYWTIDFNCDQTKLYVGGTRDVPFPSFDFHGDVFEMNMNDGSISNYVSVAHQTPFGGGGPGANEVRAMCFSPNGNLYYLSLDSIGSITQGFSINYGKGSGYSFPYYAPYSNSGGGQGGNGIRATDKFIYSTNGQVLDKRDINTGTIITSVNITGGSPNANTGVAVDSCGNVYVGAQSSVSKYDGNLNFITSANVPGPVYDVSIGANGDVLVSGQGYAYAINMSACNAIKPICFIPLSANAQHTNTGCGANCNGTATVSAAGGTAPFTYIWSNNQTTPSVTGLCAGTYYYTITDSLNNTYSDSVVITGGVPLSVHANGTNTACGTSNGTATATPNNGNAPFTYSWNTGGNTNSINNLPPGSYYVTVSDATGCSGTASATVGTGSGATATASATSSIMCAGDSTQVCVNGNYVSYLWNTGETTHCIYATGAGNYYVTVTDNFNCTATSNHVAISVYPVPSVSISINGDTLHGYNSPTYQWYLNGQPISGATNPVYIATQSGDYSLAVSDSNGCIARSNPAHINVAGIEEILQEGGVSVYPNPLENGSWHLTVSDNWLGSYLEIFDDNGRLIKRSEVRNAKSEIDFDAAKGVYLLRIYNDHKIFTQKLIRL